MRHVALLPAWLLVLCTAGCGRTGTPASPAAGGKSAAVSAASLAALFEGAEEEAHDIRCTVRSVDLMTLAERCRGGFLYRDVEVSGMQTGTHLFCGVDANWMIQVDIFGGRQRDSFLEPVESLLLHVNSPAVLLGVPDPVGKDFALTLRRLRRDGLSWFTVERTPSM